MPVTQDSISASAQPQAAPEAQPAVRQPEQARLTKPTQLPARTAEADTTAHDTVPDPAQMHIAMTRPPKPAPRGTEIHDYSSGTSWIILSLVTLFVLIAVRFRRNLRFTGSLLRELTDAPASRGLFDDTMRETAFIVLLNLLCIASAGVLLWQSIGELALPGILTGPGILLPLLRCLLCVTVLYGVQRIAYFFIGRIFFNSELTRRLLRAFSASQGILSLVLLPLVLLGLFYPAALPVLVIPAIIAWILARLMFIVKGFRIFSPRAGQYIGFLYYLCSVEIIPVVLTCSAAVSLCHS